jgi:hypothetical protein
MTGSRGPEVERRAPADVDSQRRARRWGSRGSLILFVAYATWNSLYFHPYVVDDAFISLRYAYNLVHGHGLVYNVGQQIEGFSNFSWVMCEALLLALGLPALAGMKFVGLASGLGTVVLTYLLAGRLFAGQPWFELKRIVAVGLLSLNMSLAVWTQAGLETVLLALLLLAMCLRFEVELAGEDPFPWSAVLFALAWMTRPEVPIYALYFVARRWIERDRRPWGRADVHWLVAAGAVIIPYEAWGLWYYGKLFPATHNAKIGDSGWSTLARQFQQFLAQSELNRFLFRQGWGFPAMLSLAAAGWVVGRRSLRLCLWLVPVCGLIFVLYARLDWMPRHRLFVPVIPFVCMLVAFGMGELLQRARGRTVWVVALGLACATATFDYARFQLVGGNKPGRGLVLSRRNLDWFLDVPHHLSYQSHRLQGVARFLLRNVPPGEPVCLRDIGLPGYLTMNPIWDLPGLVTPSAARAKRDSSPESLEALYDELIRLRPGCFYLDLPPAGESLGTRIALWLRTDPEISAQYREASRFRKAAFGSVVVYLRRDLPAFDIEARMHEARARVPDWRGADGALAEPARP